MRNEDDDTIVDGNDDDVMVDMTDVGEFKFEVLPKGDYNVIISELEYKLSKASSQPMWGIVLEVEDHPEYSKRKLFANASFSPKALPGTNSMLKIIAPELYGQKFNPKAVAAGGTLLGRRAKVKVDIKIYENQPQNQVKRWMPLGIVSATGVAVGGSNAFIESATG